jgi:hypothetical protein
MKENKKDNIPDRIRVEDKFNCNIEGLPVFTGL